MKRQPLFNDRHIHNDEIRVKFDDHAFVKKVAGGIIDLLPTGNLRNIIIVCIGTDRSTGDSLGPLVGSFLEESGMQKIHLYGTLDDPVHAVNLEEKLQLIYKYHFRPFVIGIDACLGKSSNIGTVKVDVGPVKPGSGVNKDLPPVGDIHLTGIVNVSGYMELFVLQNTRLNLVMKMAKQIASAIKVVDHAYSNKKSLLQLEWDMDQEASMK